jgi:hypothetical protein
MTQGDDRRRSRPLLDPRHPSRPALLAVTLVLIGVLLLAAPCTAGALPAGPATAAADIGTPFGGSDQPDEPADPPPAPGPPAAEGAQEAPPAPGPPTTVAGQALVAEAEGRGLPFAAGVGLGLLAGLVIGSLAGLLAGRMLAAQHAATTPAPQPSPAPATPAPAPGRAALVQALIDARDQVTSAAIAERMALALREAGVTELRADGEPFDPQHHQAVDHVATSDPSLDGTVAATERPGYVDGQAIVRLPQVVVHRYQP